MSTPRLCIICGARVINHNPKADTCSTDCTDKKHRRASHDETIQKRDLHFHEKERLYKGNKKLKFIDGEPIQ